jgi:FlaA1/EpsC-like NDP-sugar epimerase
MEPSLSRGIARPAAVRMSSSETFLRRLPHLSLLALAERLSLRFDTGAYRRLHHLLINGCIVALALWAAYMLRFDGSLPVAYQKQFLAFLPFAVSLYLAFNYLSGVDSLVWRYISMRDAVAIADSVVPASLVFLSYRLLDRSSNPIPLGVLVIHPLLTYFGFVGVRVLRRTLHRRTATQKTPEESVATRKRLLLVGAGEAGLRLLHELSEVEFKVVGFLDDDDQMQGRSIGGWRVLGNTQELESIVKQYAVDEVVLCMPSAPKLTRQKIAARCATLPVKASSVPTLWEIMSGQLTIDRLRSVNAVSMEDLLGRDTISYPKDLEDLSRTYRGRRILVTGAGGSIGSELIRQLRQFKPSQLILLDKDENNLYEMACEIREDFANVTEVVADIRDLDLIKKLFERHRPEVVFHAAAYKQVPLMEHYPAEAILNNVIGTRNLAQVSDQFGVKSFVLISTDKAVNPTSTMGASKRVAEVLLQKLAATGTKTRFCCVRFGNVLGSRASVVPIFQRQIRQRRNITVTHPEVRRYFMTIPEAVQLVIQAGSLGNSGEIFLLDMGDPVKIVDLARNLIELSGLVPDKDVDIEFTGLRPGEKLDEELLISGEQGVRSTKYSKIFVVEALQRNWSEFEAAVARLETAARAVDATAIRESLLSLNIGYQVGRVSESAQEEGASELIDTTDDEQEIRKATRVRFPSGVGSSTPRRATPSASLPTSERRVVQ